MFKDLVFYLEIFHEGTSLEDSFKNKIEEYGGKISKRLGNQVTHLIWGEGRLKTLQKAIQYENIMIVSTLWLLDCEKEMKRLDEQSYKPAKLEAKLREARGATIQTITRQL